MTRLIFFFFIPFIYSRQPTTVVSCSLNNVLIQGSKNPLEALIENAPANAISLSTDNGKIIQTDRPHKFAIIPDSVGSAMIYVYKKKRLVDSVAFLVHQMPSPAAFLGNKKGGPMKKTETLAMGGVIARYEGLDIDAPIKVVDYRVFLIRDSAFIGMSFNVGNRFNEKTNLLIRQSKTGDNLLIASIHVMESDGKIKTIAGREYTIVE